MKKIRKNQSKKNRNKTNPSKKTKYVATNVKRKCEGRLKLKVWFYHHLSRHIFLISFHVRLRSVKCRENRKSIGKLMPFSILVIFLLGICVVRSSTHAGCWICCIVMCRGHTLVLYTQTLACQPCGKWWWATHKILLPLQQVDKFDS